MSASSAGDFDAVFAEPPEARPVRFRDTEGHLLDSQGYSLRVRKEDPDQEITLKLRTPDIFVSGFARVRGGQRRADEIRGGHRPAGGSAEAWRDEGLRAIDPQPLLPIDDTALCRPERALDTLDDAFGLFRDLEKSLVGSVGETPKAESTLLEGPDIREYVFKSEDVRLIKGVEIGFALTLWYFDRKREPDRRSVPNVAEVSFKWEIEKRDEDKDKNGSPAAARRR